MSFGKVRLRRMPASKDIRRMVDEAYGALPPGEWQVRVRSDSAAYEPEGILDHWQGQGWEFGVSADLSPQLRRAILELPEEAWHGWQREARGAVRDIKPYSSGFDAGLP